MTPLVPTVAARGRQDVWFILAIFVAIFLYYPEMFFLKLSILSADHRAQHYPWAAFYAEGLRQFKLPWWTTRFHCGFPLLAEGQVGAFYPLNLVFYFLFPLFGAYTYGILVHFILGGLLFYGYLRSLKLSNWASLFGTLAYLFGTAQGGYFYSTASQKVLIWLPLTFYLFDQIIERKRRSHVLWLGLVFSFQLFGGYLQYAVYSIGFSVFYLIWVASSRLKEEGWNGWFEHLGWCLVSLLVAGVLSAPQLFSTWELAQFSNRFSYQEAFAYVGSMNPLALAVTFVPHWDGFLGAEIYVGTISLFLVLISLCGKKMKKEWFFIAMCVVALGLALGKFNPLFVALIKATHFYGFRTPTKFLFFLGFGLAVLSAYGFEKLMLGKGRRPVLASRIFTVLCLLSILVLALTSTVLKTFEAPIKEIGRDYIESHFAGSPLHTLPTEAYFERLEKHYNRVLRVTEFFQPWNVAFALVIALTWLFTRTRYLFSKPFPVALLFLNLYAYGFTDIKVSYRDYSYIDSPSKIIEYLKGEKGIFRIHRAPSTHAGTNNLKPIVHGNILYDLDVTGAYSPLVLKDYFELFHGLGDVNDSQHELLTSSKALVEKATLLDFLNAKYVVTDLVLDSKEYTEILQEGVGRLYSNEDALPRAFFVTRGVETTRDEFLEEVRLGRFTPTRKVYLIKDKPEKRMGGEEEEEFRPIENVEESQEEVKIEFESPGIGYLVTSDLYYPGWRAWLNGREVPILKANGGFRAIEIPLKGKYSLHFSYEPFWKKLVWVTLVGSLGAFLTPFLFLRREKK